MDPFFCWVGVSPYKEFGFLKGSFWEITMEVWKDYKKSSDLEKRSFYRWPQKNNEVYRHHHVGSAAVRTKCEQCSLSIFQVN